MCQHRDHSPVSVLFGPSTPQKVPLQNCQQAAKTDKTYDQCFNAQHSAFSVASLFMWYNAAMSQHTVFAGVWQVSGEPMYLVRPCLMASWG